MLNIPKLLQLISANFLWWKKYDMWQVGVECCFVILIFHWQTQISSMCKRNLRLYERGESWEYDVSTFFLVSWGCWDMSMPFWGKLIACSATKSKIPLFCELQFPKVHCSSKAVITMQHVLKENYYTFHEEKDNLGIAVHWLKQKI